MAGRNTQHSWTQFFWFFVGLSSSIRAKAGGKPKKTTPRQSRSFVPNKPVLFSGVWRNEIIKSIYAKGLSMSGKIVVKKLGLQIILNRAVRRQNGSNTTNDNWQGPGNQKMCLKGGNLNWSMQWILTLWSKWWQMFSHVKLVQSASIFMANCAQDEQ